MTDLFMRALLLTHVGVGAIGLAAFWVPVFTTKGSLAHKAYGRIFRNCAYVALGTAATALTLRTIAYLAAGETPTTLPARFGAIVFLAYLTLVSFVIVRHGVTVLKNKATPGRMNTPLNAWLARAAIAASVMLVAYALVLSPPNRILLYALSPIGLFSGLGILRYIGTPPGSPRQWLYEHLGAMIGGGIAFHTAFAVFGANRLFDIGLEGWIAVIPWIAPAAIGIPATVLWTRHYQRKFGESA